MDKAFKDKLLKSDSGISSMRWALIELIPIIKWTLIAIPFILGAEAVFLDSVDWIGASAFVAAEGVFITGLLGMKAVQKRGEE